MSEMIIPRWLITLAVAVAVPSISCVGYYNLENLGQLSTLLTILVILAWPATLIGLSWFISVTLSTKRTTARLWFSAICFALPAVFLIIINT